MPATHGREHESVIERLLREPERFGFFQAVRLALLWFAQQGVPPGEALERRLRFRNSVALGFPASEIEAVALQREGDAAASQLHITATFMGLLGTHGALPAHFTERVVAWESGQQDGAPRAFLDLLSNRMLALFYQSWRKYRVEHAVADGGDGFEPLLLALAGFYPRSALQNTDGLCDDAVAYYAGLIQQRPLSSRVLARILSSYLGVPLAVKEMADYWDVMAPAEQTCLGLANATLGDAAVAGARCWRPDLHVRIRIGPLDRAAYERFLPGRAGAVALEKMLGLFGVPTLVYTVALVLGAGEVRPIQLGGSQRTRLGLDSFMLDGPAPDDRTDMRFQLRPMRPLRPLAAGA